MPTSHTIDQIRPSTSERRHDLDALRAFAMLLGIALHACLSFALGIPWPVQDTQRSGGFVLFFLAVHGFRMPLFFLVSGYFAALLWRRRGPAGLLRNRTLRILIPCLLAMVTINPLISALPTWVSGGSLNKALVDDGSLVAAVRLEDEPAARDRLDRGAKIEEKDPTLQLGPLYWAALEGNLDIARLLVERGADVKAKAGDGTTPLHGAAFLGRPEMVRFLLEKGADPNAKGDEGSRPLESARADWEFTSGLADYLQVKIGDREDVARRRAEVVRLLEPITDNTAERTGGGRDLGPFSGLLKAYDAALGSERLAVWIGGHRYQLVKSSVFAHLWFLWFLCWLVPLFVLFMEVASRLGWKRPPGWIVVSPASFLWLIPLTFLPQYFMGIAYPNFGPDTAEGVILPPHLLLYYGIFFGFGALYYFDGDERNELGKGWPWLLPLALSILFFGGLMAIPNRPLSSVLQPAYAWAMCFGMIGLFRRLHPDENRAIRYVSDSSYWLYLAHLPIVLAAQAIVRDWTLGSFWKFSIVFLGTSALLLASYQLLVRHTWLGWLLNGTRHRAEHDQETSTPSA
ncbi:acyltransferase family protein [Aquisphaera insulae]|uniref:acyltransferase family protein n=1 Tax=Aquisphaera insulae TaxID=2712864 RepID=UPI0013EDBD2C|nr:acyltransferase family protein [Aquisphaera insulae]